MSTEISEVLKRTPVVPLVQADDPETAIQISRALAAGGLNVVEVVFRTDAALECLSAVAAELPEVIAGAGTVLNSKQAEQAISAGAKFVVSPGLDAESVLLCKSRHIPVYPGTMTPTEVMAAVNLGLIELKFFPASLAGGIPMLKALASVFRGVRFMPTGGVSLANLAEFLAVPSVLACGGSWLTPADAIKAGNYEAITQLAAEAVAVAKKVRG
jgi:2-dehydro-3-deoxyphosphogluconate aldolase/(4S)-4-hydroxy-2-oxoglutarate aldolase